LWSSRHSVGHGSGDGLLAAANGEVDGVSATWARGRQHGTGGGGGGGGVGKRGVGRKQDRSGLWVPKKEIQIVPGDGA
jgi:hypothetical protein